MENNPNRECQLYNDVVMDRFMNPQNVGDVENADGIGEVGAAACGDILRLSVKIDNGIITDAKFKAFGCGTAISAADMACSLLKGRSVEDVEKNFTNEDVLNALGGADEWKNKMPQKIHCSVLGQEAVLAAIEDYKKRIKT